MDTLQQATHGWQQTLRADGVRPIPEAEKARRREETRRLLAFRDRLPPVVPDTTDQYLHELRTGDDAQEESARRAHR